MVDVEKIEKMVERYRLITTHFNLFIPPVSFGYTKRKKLRFSMLLEYWKRFISDPVTNKKIDLYISIPFCMEKRCSYCMYTSQILKSKTEIDEYLNVLAQMMEQLSPILAGYKLNSLYIGGGTPNTLNYQQMELLLNNIFQHFRFKEDSEKTFENSPLLYDSNKLSLLRFYGINRVSFGVQSFDPIVLNNVNRNYVSPNNIHDIVEYAKELGFQQISMDLMLGLSGQTKESFISSFQRMLEINPGSITVYIYRHRPTDLLSISDRDAYISAYYNNLVYPALEMAQQEASKYGYKNICNGNNVLEYQIFRNDNFRPFSNSYNTRPSYSSNSCLGLGPGSNSFIDFSDTLLFYKTSSDITQFNISNSIYSGVEELYENKMRLYILDNLYRYKKVELKKFEMLFGNRLEDCFEFEISCLHKLGKITCDTQYLHFLYRDNMECAVYSMFFYNQRDIICYEHDI